MRTQYRLSVCVTLPTLLFLSLTCPSALAQKGEMTLTGSKEALALFLQARQKAENLQDPGTLFEQAIQKDPNFALAYLFAGTTNQQFRTNVEKAANLTEKVSAGEREWILAVKDQVDNNPSGRKMHL